MAGTPDWNLLPLLSAVVEHGSISAAARKLSTPKSSVSRGVAALERELGVQLLHRTTREVKLTTAGEAFYARARPVLAAYQQLTASIPERESEPSGTIRITTPVDMGLTFLPAVFAQFLVRYPSVSLDVVPTNRPVDLVKEGFDVALRLAAKLKDSTLVARRLAAVDLAMFAAPNYVAQRGALRSLDECGDHSWVLFNGLHALPAQLKKRPHRVVTDDLVFAHGMARAGTGISVLPMHLAQDDVVAGRLVRVLPGWKLPTGSVYFVHPHAEHVPRKVTALRDYLVKAIKFD